MTLIEQLDAVCASGRAATVAEIDAVLNAFVAAYPIVPAEEKALTTQWSQEFRDWDMRGRKREKQGPMPSSRDHRLTAENIDSYPAGTRVFMAIRTMVNSGVPINTNNHRVFTDRIAAANHSG